MSLKLVEEVIAHVRGQKLTLAFAESCTGGLLAATVTATPGVSDIFLGSLVSYADSAKQKILQVSPETLQQSGAVSLQTVQQMAKGARELFESDIVISISGIAGPSGGSVDKPVGTVFYYFLGPGFEYAEQKLFAGSRLEIQKQSVEFALTSLLNALR